MMFGVDAIITEHLEMFFRDMNNKPLDEIQSRNRFNNGFIIFMSSVVEGYIFPIIIINTRGSDNRSAEISADVFNGDIRSAKVGFSTNIETISMFGIHFIFNLKNRTNVLANDAIKCYDESKHMFC